MLGIVQRLFKNKNGFEQYRDLYSTNTRSKFSQLCAAINRRLLLGEVVILVSHFASTFEELQENLERNHIPYEIGLRNVNRESLKNHASKHRSSVLLVLAETLNFEEMRPAEDPMRLTLAVMVAERHPLPSHDRRIEESLRRLPGRVRIGYFLALDECTVRAVVTDTTVQLLKQFGLNDHELVTSSMVSKRLRIGLSRVEKSVTSETPSASPEEWWTKNFQATKLTK